MLLMMKWKALTLVVLLGLIGCAETVTCADLEQRAMELDTLLVLYPEAPLELYEARETLRQSLEAFCP